MPRTIEQIEQDINMLIDDYKLEINGSFEHPLSDQLIAKDALKDLIKIYFEEIKRS